VVTRSQGKSFLATMTTGGTTGTQGKFGFSNSAVIPDDGETEAEHDVVFHSTGLLVVNKAADYANVGAFAAGTDYQVLFCLGSYGGTNGASTFIKGGVYTDWTLIWTDATENTASLYPFLSNYSSSDTNLFDNALIPTDILTPSIMFQPNFLDTFTGTNDDQLVSDHTPEVVAGAAGTGDPWESGGTTWTIQGNEASNDPGLEASLWDADAAVFTSGTYSWAAIGGNSIANDSNTLKITYSDDANGAYDYFRDSSDLTANTVVGKIYKYTSDAKVGSGDSCGLGINDGDNAVEYVAAVAESFTTYSVYLSSKSETTAHAEASGMGAGDDIWFDDLILQEVTLDELFASDDLSLTQGIFDINLTIPAVTDGMAGLVLALDSDSSPANFIQVYYNRATGKVEAWKCVAGTYTLLIDITKTYAAGAQLRAIVDYVSGTDDLKLKVYYNGALIGTEQTIEDNGIAGNTRHGIMSTSSSNTLNNFTVHNRTDGDWDTEITSATGGVY